MAKDTESVTEFGVTTRFDGKLICTGVLIISGKFNGTIESSGDLEISKSAECTVDTMSAKSVVVSGRVTGDIEGRERVELCKGSAVKGDIKTTNLRIADSVEFEGSVSMLEDEPEIDLFALGSEEFKQALVRKTSEVR